MTRLIFNLFFLFVLFAANAGTQTAQAQAQSAVFVQIEAQPSLARAQESLRGYAADLNDVNGFSLGGGWYAIALGPYSPDQAADVLSALRAERLIPRDSYIAQPSDYQQQFWPIGSNIFAGDTGIAEPVETTPLSELETAETQADEPEIVEPAAPDETPREAQASEAELTRDQRAELQIALKWAGFYDGAIDAAFGRGTRNSMAGWQSANDFEVTGILTTLQRAELLRQYNAVLDGLDLRVVQDETAGIEMRLPMGVVAFDRYESPFAHYEATGEIEAKVLLISQEGDSATLGGLFDIMQTLEIVPAEGDRKLESDSFLLIGRGTSKVSHTQAWLKDGEIKGFTLVWPAGDEERRTRLLGEMQESFQRLPGVLPVTAGAAETQSIDLVAGLEIRKPRMSHSGFYVDPTGTVVTTSQVVQNCERITIDEVYDATVAMTDAARGIAVLRPVQSLAPMNVAAFQMSVPRLQSDVAVAGYSYGGVLGAPTLTFGRLADVKGLNGEQEQKRLALDALEGDAGGPVMDTSGGVLGMLLPSSSGERQLPEGVSFAAAADAVAQVLLAAGITPAAASDTGRMASERLSRAASSMTVLVSCWE